MCAEHLEADTRAEILADSGLRAKLQELRQTDNFTNWWYLLGVYMLISATLAATIGFYAWQAAAGISWAWNVPITLVAIVIIGACQHQLTGLAHEASHYTLFKNRKLNDVISDWFCMFPLFSSTHHYRLQHMAHHQFVNDEELDPDVSQLQTSGHWLNFPLTKAKFLFELAKQLYVVNLAKYILTRAKYNSTGTTKSPYIPKDYKPSRVLLRVGLLYLVSQVILLTIFTWFEQRLLLATVPWVMLAAAVTFFARCPEKLYHQSRVKSAYSGRVMTMMRITFLTLAFNALAWGTLLTGHWLAVYALILWVVPIFTSFSFFMILRQLVQHGNGDRGFVTNTRVFFVNPFIRFAVFPMGQDYHLPHHMFATIPHYRLAALHRYMLSIPAYRDHATVVEGYFRPLRNPPKAPTVLDVLGEEHARHHTEEVYVDHDVLTPAQVEDRDAIMREARKVSPKLAEHAQL